MAHSWKDGKAAQAAGSNNARPTGQHAGYRDANNSKYHGHKVVRVPLYKARSSTGGHLFIRHQNGKPVLPTMPSAPVAEPAPTDANPNAVKVPE